jgi:ADP-ribose pyrophosphatase YjhB (NUDIX family)
VGAQTQTVKAMAVIRRPHDGALLVSQYTGPDADPFHRPLGGHVEFGEYAVQTVHREFEEETGQRLAGVRLLGVLENIFQWKGNTQHEVVFLFRAGFVDPAAYEIAEQRILDSTDDWTRVIWRPPRSVTPPLYPAGAMELITRDLRPPRWPANDRQAQP